MLHTNVPREEIPTNFTSELIDVLSDTLEIEKQVCIVSINNNGRSIEVKVGVGEEMD